MFHVNKLLWNEGNVFALSEEEYSYFMIQKYCDMHGIKISKCKLSNIINWKAEEPTIITSTCKEDYKRISEKSTYCFKSF